MRHVPRQILAGALVATVVFLAAPAAPAGAAPPPGPGPGGAIAPLDLNRQIAADLRARLTNPRLGDDVAIQVRTPDGSGVIFTSQSTEAQMPASNMKLVTGLGALTSLGADRILTTRVALRASGTGIVLVGGGDPLLSSSNLDVLASRTVAALTAAAGGVAPTTARLFINDSLFSDGTRAPGWLSTYVPGEVTYVRALGRHGILVTDTAADAGAYFASRLKARGVAVTYEGRGAGSLGATVASIDGHDVGDAVSVMLRDSDNQVAETLFRHVALAHGQPATWAGGSAAARAVLVENGIPTTSLVLLDGSGLSRSDRLTATSMARLMALVQSGEDASLDGFVGWLPVAGRTGTLAAGNSRFTTSPSKCAAGKVYAKTGTLTGAIALSGTARGWDGSSRAFSIIVNRPPTSRYSVLTIRQAIDGLAATITGCW